MSVPKARVVRIQRVDRAPLGPSDLSTPPKVIAVDVSSQHRIPRVVHWCLLLYVLSIPLEYVKFGFTSESLTLARAAGVLFFVTYCFYYNPLLDSWPSPSRACWWFLAYAAIYMLHGFFLPEEFVSSFFSRLLTVLQLIIFFWLAGDLCKDERIMRQVLLVYAIAMSVLAVGMLLQLPVLTPTSLDDGGEPERASILGVNSNTFAAMWALASVTLAGLCLHPAYTLSTKLLWVFLVLPTLAAVVKTGSRAGMGGMLIGFLVYLVPHWRAQRKLCTLLLALLGIAVTVYSIKNSSSAERRWEQAMYEGKMAKREEIVPAALEMFRERPLLGWQPYISERELGRRTGASNRDPHNLLLSLLLEVGIVGTVPFLIGLWRCTQMAWQARAGRLGMLPLALLTTVLAAAMAQPLFSQKWFWLVLVCAANSPAAGHATRPRMLLIRRSLGNEA